MQSVQLSYLNGMCAAMYFLVCLLCGLQLCFGVFTQGHARNKYLSQQVGGVLLVMSCSAVCYMLSFLLDSDWLMHIGVSIDICMFAGVAYVCYVLYSNNEPSKGRLTAFACPFALIALLNFCFPEWLVLLFNLAALLLLAVMIYFAVIFIRRERNLDDLYANPEHHSLIWMLVFFGLFVGWWVVCLLFSLDALTTWYDMAVYLYMTGVILFAFAKVSHYATPVSLETQLAVETRLEDDNHHNDNVNRLERLMTEQQLYLNPDLTVEDVARSLGMNTKYFSALLREGVHVTFSQFVNTYRIERAKQLLLNKDEKVVNLAQQCGFNSNQSFYRTFMKFTGATPSEWRSSHSPR